MSLDRLAQVELQLVMHCDQRTLLALARCNHLTFAAASHDFAWRHVPQVVIDAGRLIAAAFPPLPPLQRLGQCLRCAACCPSVSESAAPPPRGWSSWSLLRHADQLLRWNGPGSSFPIRRPSVGDAFRSALAALPRLVAFVLPDWYLSTIRWADLEPCLPSLSGLIALDVTAIDAWAEYARPLVQHLRRLRSLHCRTSRHTRECLQLLAELPQLTDLRLLSERQEGGELDLAPVAACRSLRRLALDSVFHGIFQLLQAPALGQLRDLTLEHLAATAPRVHEAWPAAFAHLQSLRRLTVDRCGCIGAILAAVVESGGPRLRLLRIAPAALYIVNGPWSRAVRPIYHVYNPSPAALSALLQRRPEIRVELRIGFQFAGVAASWLLPLHSECDWRRAVPEWTDFQVLHPLRHKHRNRPLLFPDSELGRESPLWVED